MGQECGGAEELTKQIGRWRSASGRGLTDLPPRRMAGGVGSMHNTRSVCRRGLAAMSRWAGDWPRRGFVHVQDPLARSVRGEGWWKYRQITPFGCPARGGHGVAWWARQRSCQRWARTHPGGSGGGCGGGVTPTGADC